MRRLSVLVAAILVGAGGLGLAPAPVGAAAPYCGITWGSLAKSGTAAPRGGEIVNVRAGRHTCFDRLVIDLTRAPQGFHVAYVPRVTEDPSDRPVHLAGGAFLSIAVQAPDYDVVTGRPNPYRLPSVAGFTTFRQVAAAGSFEAVTSYGLGVRARLPFRAFILTGPGAGARLVIDVAHRWQ